MQLWIASAAIVLLLAAATAYRFLDIETLDLKSAAKVLLWPVAGILKLGLMAFAKGAPQWLRLSVWKLLNLAVISGLLHADPSFATLGVAGAMAALHLLSFVTALLVIDEETDVWNGLIGEQQAKFRSAKLLKYPSLLAFSTIGAALFLPMAIWFWDRLTPFPLFTSVAPPPCTFRGCDYVSYAAATFYQLPLVEWALRDISPLPAALNEWPGSYLTPTLTFIALALIIGVFKVAMVQKKAIRDLVVAFGRAKDRDTLAYLRQRAERAPEFIKERLIANALGHHNAEMRRRYIDAMLKAGFLDFSRMFLRKLHDEPNAWNKRSGVDQIAVLIKQNAGAFKPELVAGSLDALKRQMTELKRKHSPMVLEAMDELHIAYAGLCTSRGWSVGPSKLRRLYDLAICGEYDVRPRAFAIAATLQPVDLCHCAVEHLTLQNLADARLHPVLTGSLAQVENLVATRCSGWRRKSRTRLTKAITTRRMALVSDTQRLTGGQFNRIYEGIHQKDIGRVMPILTNTIDALDRIKAALMKTLSDLPVSDPNPAATSESKAA